MIRGSESGRLHRHRDMTDDPGNVIYVVGGARSERKAHRSPGAQRQLLIRGKAGGCAVRLKTKDQGDVAHVLRSDGRSKWMEGRMWVRRDAKQRREIRRDAGCIRRIDAIQMG
jgi:hypothetical protein